MTILIRPVITEKSLRLAGAGQFTFEVDPRATAPQVASAVHRQFKVTVRRVQTQSLAGTTRLFRQRPGRTKKIKKAIVTLVKGQAIPGFAFETKTGGRPPAGEAGKSEVGDQKTKGKNLKSEIRDQTSELGTK